MLHLNRSGELLSRSILSGSYHLVRDLRSDKKVEIRGDSGGQGQLIQLTDDLKEASRITGSLPESMNTSLAYRLADGTLRLFGSKVHSIGQRIRPVVIHLDATLHTMQTFEPGWSSTNVIVNLRAVAPLSSKSDFVSAVGLTKSILLEQLLKIEDAAHTLALDYLRLQ